LKQGFGIIISLI